MVCKHCFRREARKGGCWCQRCVDTFNKRVKHLPKITALFECGEPRVCDVYIVNENPDLIIANTDGYDDWGHVMSYSPGVLNGKEYDYIDKGAW